MLRRFYRRKLCPKINTFHISTSMRSMRAYIIKAGISDHGAFSPQALDCSDFSSMPKVLSKCPKGNLSFYVMLKCVGHAFGRDTGSQEDQEAANKVIERLCNVGNQVDRIYSMSLFKEEVTQAIDLREGLTDDDLTILLRYLDRDKSAVIYDEKVSPCFGG